MASGTDERGWRDGTDARTRMLFANVGRKRDSSDVALTVMYAHDRAFLAGSLPESWVAVDPRANFTGGDFFEPNLLHLALRGERSLPVGTVRGNVFFRRNNIEQFNVNVDAPSTRALIANRSGGGAAEWSAPMHLAGRDLAMTVGAEYARNDVGYHTFAEPAASQVIPPDCGQTSGLCEHARVPEDDASLYAQGLLTISPKLAFTAAARADYVRIPFRDLLDPENDGTSVFRRISPRIGATFRLDASTSGYASASTGFRAPAALELACADENAPCSLPSALGDDPPLAPVTVRTYEAGLDRDLTHDARIGISAYRTDVRNEIVFVASTLTAGFFQNIPRTRREGVEVTGDAALPAGFRATGSYNYLDATYQSTVALASELDDNVARPGDRFPLSPAHQATLSIENTHAFRASVLGVHLSLKAMSGQYLRGDDANRERPLPGYATTDASASWQTSLLALRVYVTNLFDRTYNSFGTFGENPSGPIGGPAPEQPVLERFLTPGYPRTLTVSVSVHR
jgi:outer membrane receptor protein involved in Fe transport